MDKNLNTFLIVSLALLFLITCREQEKQKTITIAVASNYEATLKQIIKQYKLTHTQLQIELVSASSGTLANQILNHAPFDIFLSADVVKPSLIFNKLQLTTPPQIYAKGVLVLWIPHYSGINCLSKLHSVKTLAMANPKTAPYGQAAKRILNEYSINISKTIQTSNAVQAFIYTQQKLTESGFVPYSMIVNKKINGCVQVFENNNLNQSALLLNEKASKFYRYLFSASVKKINQQSGYL